MASGKLMESLRIRPSSPQSFQSQPPLPAQRCIDRAMRVPRTRTSQAEPPHVLLYSFRCPCPGCAARIARFAQRRERVRVELAFERSFIPPEFARLRPHGDSDASSLRLMRESGVVCTQFSPSDSE